MHGLTPLDPQTLATLRRWRQRPLQHDRRQVWLALGVVALLHAGFMLAIHQTLRAPSQVTHENLVTAPQIMHIRFIQQRPPRAAVAPPPPLNLPQRSATPPPKVAPVPKTHEPPAKNAMTIQLATSKPAPRLYDPNGEALVPPPPSSSAPNYVSHALQGDSTIMRHDNPVEYHATRFANDWGKGGGPVTQALEKAVKKTTVKHTFHLPRGIRIHCAVSLAMLAGGCGGDPPPPPPPKDGDARLSMAPAKPLAADPNPTKPPSVAACIAMYRAGKPLAYGCPMDTPAQAVDLEMKQEKATRERKKAAPQGH